MADDDYKQVFSQQGYVTTDPIPTKEELSEFYNKKYYQDTPSETYQTNYSKTEISHKKLIAKQHVYSIEEYVCKGRLLDVGCGEGFDMAAAAKTNWSVAGIDFSSFGVEKFNKQVLGDLRVGDAYDLLNKVIDDKEKYNACILTNVLEHVLEPEKLLYKMSECLEDNGVILITVPNDNSLMQSKLKELGYIDNDYWFTPPQHLHFFNVDDFRNLFNNLGFEMLDLYSGFPIENFLFHSKSNYIKNRENGKEAHYARINIDLIMAESGMKAFHDYSRSLANCGVGRTISAVVRKVK